ncbi:MAG: hypothetical protein K1X94_34705, partial [Sandaracinaceae bacterium]|nr:hypothetical protein [Sandaracinaceae bacterium]
MIRISRSASEALVALALVLGAPALLAPSPADAQVVVRPGRGGRRGAVVVDPAPGRPGGDVVGQLDPHPRGGAVVVDPGRPGGAVVV